MKNGEVVCASDQLSFVMCSCKGESLACTRHGVNQIDRHDKWPETDRPEEQLTSAQGPHH